MWVTKGTFSETLRRAGTHAKKFHIRTTDADKEGISADCAQGGRQPS